MEKFDSDRDLVEGCIQRIPAAQRALFDRYVRAMYNTVYRYTCNYHDTQDILQEGFSKVFKYLKNFDESKGTLLSWVRKIHIRCALDHLKEKQVMVDDIETTSFVPNINPTSIASLEASYILKFIEELNPRDRLIFNMYHIEGYTHKEISELLSINENSSRVYLARTRKLLREKITAHNKRLTLVQ